MSAMRNLVVHDAGICTPPCDHRPPPDSEIEICRAWLRASASPRRTINPRANSYGLKHVVEHDSRAHGVTYTNVDRRGRVWRADRVYVSNGAFIAAAVREGYRVVQIGTGPNARFNVRLPRKVGT